MGDYILFLSVEKLILIRLSVNNLLCLRWFDFTCHPSFLHSIRLYHLVLYLLKGSRGYLKLFLKNQIFEKHYNICPLTMHPNVVLYYLWYVTNYIGIFIFDFVWSSFKKVYVVSRISTSIQFSFSLVVTTWTLQTIKLKWLIRARTVVMNKLELSVTFLISPLTHTRTSKVSRFVNDLASIYLPGTWINLN